MSIQTFVPQVWAAALLANLNDDHVYGKCANHDYEGEVSFGSSVKINSMGRVTTFAITRNADHDAPEELDMASQTLLIDQARGYNFAVDNIDERQARGEFVNEAMREASWALAEDADTFLGTTLQSGAGLSVTAATIGFGGGEKLAYDIIVQMGLALDETNTPGGNRWVVVPPWVEAMLKLDERFSGFGTDASRGIIRGAPIGQVDSFTVYKSNNVPRDGSEYSLLAGYKGAFTFAEQIEKTVAFQPERRFADATKGMHVYGAKVTRPSNIVRFDATRGNFPG